MKVHNSLPNNKILDWPLLEVFADNKLNVIEKLKFCFEKGENAGYQHFLVSYNVFESPYFQGH